MGRRYLALREAAGLKWAAALLAAAVLGGCANMDKAGGQGPQTGQAGAIWAPSPNWGARRAQLAVLHHTDSNSARRSLEILGEPSREVSAHYLLGRDGTLWQLVDENARAWHAGASAWGTVGDVNSASVGIEMCNDAQSEYPPAQLAALEALLRGVMERHRLTAAQVVGHADVAPGRKSDPGMNFPWAWLESRGLAVGPGGWERAEPVGDWAAALAQIGYASGTDCQRLASFRLRLSGRVPAGPACEAGLEEKQALAAFLANAGAARAR